MNPRRQKMVQKIFTTMDRDGSGAIQLADVVQIYDVSLNNDFIQGKKTKEQLLTEFLASFEGGLGNKDGVITKDEFFDYYTDVSISIPNDEYFVRMLESAWQCPEEEDQAS